MEMEWWFEMVWSDLEWNLNEQKHWDGIVKWKNEMITRWLKEIKRTDKMEMKLMMNWSEIRFTFWCIILVMYIWLQALCLAWGKRIGTKFSTRVILGWNVGRSEITASINSYARPLCRLCQISISKDSCAFTISSGFWYDSKRFILQLVSKPGRVVESQMFC